MKKLSKLVSLVLAAVLCFGMTSPALAASFTDFYNATCGNGDTAENKITLEDGSVRYGYGKDPETGEYGIEAWTDKNDDGYDKSRNVILKEDVKYGENGVSEQHQNFSITYGIPNQTLNLDLNGHDIDATHADGTQSDKVFDVGYPGKLTIVDSSTEDPARRDYRRARRHLRHGNR